MTVHHQMVRMLRVHVHMTKPKAAAKVHHAAIHGTTLPKAAKHVKVHRTKKIRHVKTPHH